ncbi:TetR family transcriptional regulator [Sporosarcina sp. NCCP-2716]|uniref:TetR/AcrR family transcriptional regulator n=1 Tax=Sporosarcina sp. NCCP-2716 TaxID=2943679 RepID=UPI00208C2387|nr:TetR family transcriptional regulator [Sporosarcina sp. NCCP-2716]
MPMTSSLHTKTILSRALIRHCSRKSFDKVSITDLTEECGLTRQAFYYHFADKQELLEWTYQVDVFTYLMHNISLDNWNTQVLHMLQGIKEKDRFYYHTTSSDQSIIAACFLSVTEKLFHKLFEKLDDQGLVSQKDQNFYARFFSYGCCGILVDWILTGFKESEEDIAGQLNRIMVDIRFFSKKAALR